VTEPTERPDPVDPADTADPTDATAPTGGLESPEATESSGATTLSGVAAGPTTNGGASSSAVTAAPAGVFVDDDPDRRSRLPGELARLRAGDLGALRWWAVTRIALFIGTAAAAWLLADGTSAATGFFERWLRWDAVHFDTIAQFGYDGDPSRTQVPFEAFFPGLPLAVQPLLALGATGAAAQLLVSATALAVAVVALRRLGDLERGPGVGERAALLLMISPWAVFLTAGYSEALFLGFAIPAWLAAKRDHWWLAGLLALGATTTRVSGLFLAMALVVQFVLYAKDRGGKWPAVLVPFVGPLLYTAYQYDRTGDWRRWLNAQEEGWNRTFTWPWDALSTTWNSAFGGEIYTNFIWMWRAELLAAGLAVAVCIWLLVRRRWPELVYVGGQTAALLTSSYFFSVPRAFLLWWPVWIGLAAFLKERPQWWPPLLAVFVPLNLALAITFTSNAWAG
jgi:hypothetical protein